MKENGRIVLMFCAFEGPPKIVRIYGKGPVLYPGDAEFAPLLAAFPQQDGVCAIISVAITRIVEAEGLLSRLPQPCKFLPVQSKIAEIAGFSRHLADVPAAEFP